MENLRREASKKGWKLTIEHSGSITPISKDAFMHPSNVELKHCSTEEKEKYFVAWFMELPDECAC
jgi:hypothetical protein